MNKKYLDKIEYSKILEILSSFAVTSVGKEFALNLNPVSSLEEAKMLIEETTESHILLYRKSSPPLSEIEDISIYIKTLKSEGSLSAKALLDLGHILKVARELREYFASDIDTSFCKILSQYFEGLYSNQKLEHTIFSSIIDENQIDDHASSNLFHIRKDIQKLESEIRQKLNSYLRASYIREPVVTIRAGRFVIPVKQEMRSEVNGFVHDISSSGSTVFIEPTAVFDMNNKLNSLVIEEKNEIEKILLNLTAMFYPYIEDLQSNVDLIGKIDFAFAKAKYAKEINANEPVLQDEKSINLIKARHPLIEPDKVVPISVPLGKDYSCLVVTGPNTGGKTVTLKTVGLLCSMAASGLYIPAEEKSTVCVFDNIFADIGDEQSIQESLSTFSSHMTNIIEILKSSTSKSLILLDELGSGTDPIEGSSLAISILDAFYKKQSLTLATTHYPEVKNYALVTEGFENASSEFDSQSLKPTYRLLIGVPGQSNAFAISKRLGLSDEILEKAMSFVSSDTVSVEEILKNIYEDRKIIEKEKEDVLRKSKEAEELKILLENQKKVIDIENDEAVIKAKEKAKEILLDAKEEANEIIKELEKTSSKSKANKLRKDLNEKITKIDTVKSLDTSSHILLEEIKIGDFVKIKPINTEGKILSLPDKSKKIQVQVGSSKMYFHISELEKTSKTISENIVTHKPNSILKTDSVSPEINLLGFNVEEARLALDKYLDNCVLAGLATVRVIHGKGTGALREGIQKYLKTNPHVKSFRYGTFGEGEMGVTVVELK